MHTHILSIYVICTHIYARMCVCECVCIYIGLHEKISYPGSPICCNAIYILISHSVLHFSDSLPNILAL